MSTEPKKYKTATLFHSPDFVSIGSPVPGVNVRQSNVAMSYVDNGAILVTTFRYVDSPMGTLSAALHVMYHPEFNNGKPILFAMTDNCHCHNCAAKAHANDFLQAFAAMEDDGASTIKAIANDESAKHGASIEDEVTLTRHAPTAINTLGNKITIFTGDDLARIVSGDKAPLIASGMVNEDVEVTKGLEETLESLDTRATKTRQTKLVH